MTLISQNPADGSVLAEHPLLTPAEVDDALDRAVAAARGWGARPPAERAAALAAFAAGLRGARDRLAGLITDEMGKPLEQALAEVDKSAGTLDFYAAHAADWLEPEPLDVEEARAHVALEPLGVVLGVLPWNYPVWQVVRAAAPALAAGNAFALKHASNVTGCAAELVRVAGDALPADLLVHLAITSRDVAPVIADRRIAAVTLTGSDAAGAAVAAQAGASVKKCVLELGGSDPFVILADADLDVAAATAVRARFQNSGQSCIAAKRIIVEEAVLEPFRERFVAGVEALVCGDPRDPRTDVGPLARPEAPAELRDLLERSVAAGAEVIARAPAPDGPGWWFAPTVLDGVTPDLPVARSETFGPLAAIMPAADAEQALRLANDSPYGLGASVWTEDLERGHAFARRVEAGAVFLNAMTASDPRAPIGGIKASGYGRELGRRGLHEFVNAKTVWSAGAVRAGRPAPAVAAR